MNHPYIHNEKELLHQISQGSEPAFRQLYDTYHQRIYSFAFFITRSDILAEDLVQETFIKIWTHRTELSGIIHFNAWIKTLVRNQSYSYLSRLAKERIILSEIKQRTDSSDTSTETTVQDQEYSRLLLQAIHELQS